MRGPPFLISIALLSRSEHAYPGGEGTLALPAVRVQLLLLVGEHFGLEHVEAALLGTQLLPFIAQQYADSSATQHHRKCSSRLLELESDLCTQNVRAPIRVSQLEGERGQIVLPVLLTDPQNHLRSYLLSFPGYICMYSIRYFLANSMKAFMGRFGLCAEGDSLLPPLPPPLGGERVGLGGRSVALEPHSVVSCSCFCYK